MRTTTIAAAAAGALTLLAGNAASAAPQAAGPSSSASPYLVRSVPGVVPTSLLTVGDRAGNGYRMAGIPDGMGAYDNGDGTFTVLMHHELGAGEGVVRAHGSKGSFVSRLTVDKDTLAVTKGEDLVKRTHLANPDGTWTQTTTAFNRLCSADLPDQSAFYDAASGLGTQHRIFMDGEEAGTAGRAFGHVVDGPDAGSSYELPALGNMGFENAVAKPDTGRQTVVVLTDDSTPGQVYVYVGQKRATGNDVEKAGLTDGKLYGVKIDGVDREDNATSVPAAGAGFSLVEIPDAAAKSGPEIEAASNALGVSRMYRPEDSSWDPTAPAGFYFNSTGSFKDTSRLWHLTFTDPADVTRGGRAAVAAASPAYDASKPSEQQAGPRMMDNLTVDSRGQVLVQEDPGGQEYRSGVWTYDPATGKITRVAQHDPARFSSGQPGFLTNDEESSAIIPVPFLGAGKYLLTTQAHYETGDPETVEGGQLELLSLPTGKPLG